MNEKRYESLFLLLSAPLAEWLTQWPATGGSEFERLQLALRRIPDAVGQLDARVRTAVRDTAPSV